ncbi:MAG: hypothetical protein V4450_13965 [Bacteroidota bacterium]
MNILSFLKLHMLSLLLGGMAMAGSLVENNKPFSTNAVPTEASYSIDDTDSPLGNEMRYARISRYTTRKTGFKRTPDFTGSSLTAFPTEKISHTPAISAKQKLTQNSYLLFIFPFHHFW